MNMKGSLWKCNQAQCRLATSEEARGLEIQNALLDDMKVEFSAFPGRRNFVDVTGEEPPTLNPEPDVIIHQQVAEPLFQRPPSEAEESPVRPQDINSLRGALGGDASSVGEPEAERGVSPASSTFPQRRPRDSQSSESASLRRRVDGSENPSSELRWQPTGTGWVPGEVGTREGQEQQVSMSDGGVDVSSPTSPERVGGVDASSPTSSLDGLNV